MGALQPPLVIPYGNGLRVAIEPHRPLRLNTMAWDFPERPDLITLVELDERLDFLRDHLKSLGSLWDKLPRLFLDAYFRDIRECIARNRPALDALAAVHGKLFRPEDWSFSALCPLPQARLPTAPETLVDFAFWTGADLHTIDIVSMASQSRPQREGRARLRDSGILVTEIPGAELQRGQAGGVMAALPAVFSDYWKTVPLPSSPFRIGSLADVLPP
jgi:hypothetical protein